MKKRAKAILSAMALIAILATASSTSAQSNYGIRITVPFDFTIGDKSYPAGQYTVGSSLDLIRVRSTDDKRTAFVTSTIRIGTAVDEHRSQLEFNRYGDRYFLHAVWLGPLGRQLPKDKIERELIRDLIHDRSESAGALEIETVIVTPN
jgi:hypothetical protein